MDTKGFPVENVTWFDCVAFANRLSEREGQHRQPYYRISNEQRSGGKITSATVEIAGGDGYRLPTEAEWEYGARAGTTTIFPWGDSLSSEQANFDGDYPFGGAATAKDLERTTSVGSYPANPWGLYDTAGNVWEWVWDCYGANEYKQFASQLAVDPQGPEQGFTRVFRGGNWGSYGQSCRPAHRDWFVPGLCNFYAGFRLALGRFSTRVP
jgi:formylglycine-generating enzyme required for sulfatase activity